MTGIDEARDIARGVIDVELDLVYSRDEAEQDFLIGGDDDPLVRRLGRVEFGRRRAEAERRFRQRCPD